MNSVDPIWTKSKDGTLETSHLGHTCRVERDLSIDRWFWVSHQAGHCSGPYTHTGHVDSLEVAKACALRSAEASVARQAYLDGNPPRGVPPQFSACDTTLTTPVGVHTHEPDGTLAISLWSTNEEGDPLIIGFSESVVGSRSEFLRQVGEHLVHLGKYGWTSILPGERKELFGKAKDDD